MAIKWIKINIDMFEDEKIKLIESMDKGIIVINIWLKLLLLAGKNNRNGLIYLSKQTPYTFEMLSTLFHIPYKNIQYGINILCEFKLIEILKDKKIKIVNWEKHQTYEYLDKNKEQSKERMRKKRAKDRALEESLLRNSYVTVTDETVTVTPKNKNKEIEIELEKEEEEDLILEGTYELSRIHGEKKVKAAILKAKEANKLNIFYIKGILRNWQREGCPINLLGGIGNGKRGEREFMLQASDGYSCQEQGETGDSFYKQLI
ncbi:MAG: hypothetical protein GX275_14325 [Clostridiales bacterium]|nr:hypothetical protein [Clostridiales bacterium]